METVKQDVPDTLWVGFGRKDAPIVREQDRFRDYFYAWMHPHKFKIKHVEFWPGFAWGTVKLESGEARNTLLEHVIRKPFRPDNETGWVLNRFEKCVPVYNKMDAGVESSPKKSPVSKKVPNNNKKKSSLAEVLMAIDSKKELKKGRKSRSSTASPATVNGGASALEILDLDELEQKKVIKHNSLDDEEDDSELRVKATIAKVIKGVRIVEAITKKHGQYKLSINDILGASKFKPVDLTGAEIVIVLGPLKKNQRRRDFLWAELAEDWQGPESNKENDENEDLEDQEQEVIPIKEEALENALLNLRRFYKWSIKDGNEAHRQIAALQEELTNAANVQAKVAVISDHLTLASQSFTGIEGNDDESIEDMITSTRCSSAFSDVKRVMSSVDHVEKYRKSDLIIKEDDSDAEKSKVKMMQDLAPTDEVNDYDQPRNILNISDSPVPKSRQVSGNSENQVSNQSKKVYDLPTSRQTIKANASTYTVESSAEIQIDMIYWQKMLHWLTVHHFDDAKEQAKDHAKWVVIVWELAGITPTNLKSEIIGHAQTVPNFCTRLSEMLESKKSKIPFWNNLSISNLVHATLCYLLAKEFPAESVPKCMSHLFTTIPYVNNKTGSLYQIRGYVDKYISDEKGLIMSPKGYVLFNSYSIVGVTKNNTEEEVEEQEELTVPIGTHVLFNAVKVEESLEDGKKFKYYVASNVWTDPDYQVYYNDLGKQISVLHTSAMAKVLHRANSNLSDEAFLSMYEDGLSKVGKQGNRIDLKNLLVDKTTMDSLKPLVDFLRTRLELRLDIASNVSLMYASVWARIGYDLEYLRDDFHTLNSVGSRGCVIYNWEKLLLNFKLPNCLEMGHLVRETLAYLSTTSAKYKSIDLVDGKSLYNIAIKRTKVDRHHQLLKGDYDQGSLWIPQPFQRAKLLEAVIRPKSSFPEDDHLVKTEENSSQEVTKLNGEIKTIKKKSSQLIKVKPEDEEMLTFDANDDDDSLDAELVEAIIKGTIAFKYKIQNNIWRIISKTGNVFPCPPDGWSDRIYIPIKRQITPPRSPCKTPLTPANSLAPPTPVPSLPPAMTPDAIVFEQIRQQFQNQMQLQEHYNNLVAQHQQQAAKGETTEELLQRHGFR